MTSRPSTTCGTAPGTGSGKLPEAGLALGGLVLDSRVLAAPLSGITDVPFRRILRRLGAGLVFSEMVASGELLRDTRESLKRVMADGGRPRAVQLAGRDPALMRAAARRLAEEGVELIDINFGCPAKKVVGGQCGSALMREPELARALMAATVEGAAGVPVSVKMRLGWDAQSHNAADIARDAQRIGLAMVTVHGRTRADFYTGQANWSAIRPVREAIGLPLVVNGDIRSLADARRARAASGADAVMIGRGLCGRPWLAGLLAGRLTAADLSAVVMAELVCRHYEDMLSHYGTQTGLRHARKHLGWYLDARALRVAEEPELRAQLLRASDPKAVLDRLADLFHGLTAAELEPAFSEPSREAA
ncbi:tRNA dihydrouridine synthase DusB [Aureimonas frigidaquae]|uniref:tRNA-dihydrouridine synthase n=1 Tax=Aureimonas frigidaquae TaxID=424757 RepID=A0A0P0Z3Q9_9HYPH|nr:tRNA dihydrouridine synthase DusB [Aureimonas frigidaquae]BAT28434.1 tRNA-dihydrouridine synthase [Aureimonas frigidaquae]